MVRLSLVVAIVWLGGCGAPRDETPAGVQAQAAADQVGPAKIAEFQGAYRFLSNFWPAEIEFEGITYPTVEHAYQSAKTMDMTERRRIAGLATPSEAKAAGRALEIRSDWETAKFEVMEVCVRAKFTRHKDLGVQLVATGDALLEEGNTWGDRIWGVFEGQGENRLGKILMKVRSELTGAAP